MRNLTPLTGPCDNCGQPGFLHETYPDGSGNYFCPTHRTPYALSVVSVDDLGEMFKAAVRVWYAAWGHLPYTHGFNHIPEEAAEMARAVTRDVMRELGYGDDK